MFAFSGGVQLLAAASIAYFVGYLPLEATKHHESVSFLAPRLLICCSTVTPLFVLGTLRLLFGLQVVRILFTTVGIRNRPSPAGWGVTFLCVLVALLMYFRLTLAT
jgi:hypothetical protein